MPAAPIQRPAPPHTIRPRRRYTLPLTHVHPLSRIAHHQPGALRIAPRVIFDHELVLLTRGGGVFTREGVGEPLAAGDLLLIRPFERHGFDVPDPCAHLAVHFDLAPAVPDPAAGDRDRATYAVALAEGTGWPARVALADDDPIRGWLNQVVDLFTHDDPAARAECGLRLLQVLLALLRRTRPAADHRLQRVAAFVAQQLHRPLDAADLAAAAGLSASQLRRLLLQWTGLTPMAYLRRARVDRARRLLADRDADLSVKQVAYRCGFPDPFHFSRVFRLVDGLSPTQFRRAARP